MRHLTRRLRGRVLRRASARDRGAAMVEFALVLPILLLILCGIIDFGRAMHAQVTLTEAAREGARAESLGSDPGSRVAEATANLGPVGTAVESSCPGEDAIVTVTYDFEFITPIGPLLTLYGGGFDDSTVPMSGRGVMPCFS